MAEPVAVPIDGTLDLHLYQPAEAADLVRTYLQLCRERGIYEVRVIHGKGTGALRRTVHHTLERIAFVHSFAPASAQGGGWGATIVRLEPA